VVAPASAYLRGPLRLAHQLGAAAAVVVHGKGRFARQVANGALAAAGDVGIDVHLATEDEWQPERGSGQTAVMTAGSFEEDVHLVARVKDASVDPALLAAVAAGIAAFGTQLGERSEGVVGPAQWFFDQASPIGNAPEIGPASTVFTRRFHQRFGRSPDYPAAQAVAAGALAVEAARRKLTGEAVQKWTTNTLLGPFALDENWKQTALEPVTVRWRAGTREQVPTGDAGCGQRS
jgi:branched-chain amino acid transport system substrate-binding protein